MKSSLTDVKRKGKGPFEEHLSNTQPPVQPRQREGKGKAHVDEHTDIAPPVIPLPRRPGQGRYGTPCEVLANHFLAKLRKDLQLNQYDVTITPEIKSRGFSRAIMKNLVNRYPEQLDHRLPAYDGRKMLYTARPLPFDEEEFQIHLENGDNDARRERAPFKVVIKRTSFVKVLIKSSVRENQNYLHKFLADMGPDVLQSTIQAFDTVLQQTPMQDPDSCLFGQSFHSKKHGSQDLGNGVESWGGFYQSVRPTQNGFSLNIDISSTAFVIDGPVPEFVRKLLNKDIREVLNDVDRTVIDRNLTGMQVEVTHRGLIRRKYRISGISTSHAAILSFPIPGPVGKDVQPPLTKKLTDYFRETYQYTLRFPHLPCLQIGNRDPPTYLPMEVCNIVEGQRYSKRLNNNQTTRMLEFTCLRPDDREKQIQQMVNKNAYAQDLYAKEFGITISNEMAIVKARILQPPTLKYRDGTAVPKDGKWKMSTNKMIKEIEVTYWACINFSPEHVSYEDLQLFCDDFAHVCRNSGMRFEQVTTMRWGSFQDKYQVEDALMTTVDEEKGKIPVGGRLQLIVAILPDKNRDLYGHLKRICETQLDTVSQCCLKKHVKKNSQALHKRTQYMANVALKINVKLGGTNTVLADSSKSRIHHIFDVPTIIFGADVTHPHPGDASSPSVAAVVASQDWPAMMKYAGVVSRQNSRRELIQDLYTMIRELLPSFQVDKTDHQLPEQIIFYRDGVSEGQFNQVLDHEVDAIQKACASLKTGYAPKLTFIVVQKRHHTRLFRTGGNSKDASSGNILPGTVVDSQICHPTQFDFYLCSHAGVKGTSRPAHYHVLLDQIGFTADGLQTLTNNLCYTYARCTRSVSVVPPAYYAHLLAFRARSYIELADDGTFNFHQPRENVKTGMFFC